jgi:ABC-2 type transport system permease protein
MPPDARDAMTASLHPIRAGVSIALAEFRLCSRRFSLWMLVALSCGLGYVFCTPWIRLFAGDGPTSQAAPLARNSAYALSMAMAGLSFLLAPFVASISAETAVRDRRARLLPLALVTPVARSTYLLAKCAAATVASLTPLLGFLAGVVAAQLFPQSHRLLMPANVIGPLAALLQFGLPFVCAIAVVSFCLTIQAAEPKRAYIVVTLLAVAELALYATSGLREYRWLSNVDPLGLLSLLDVGSSGRSNLELSALRWPGGPGFSLNRVLLVLGSTLFLVPATRALPLSGGSDLPAGRRGIRIPRVLRSLLDAIAAAARPVLERLRLIQRLIPARLVQTGAVAVAELRLLVHEQSLLIFVPLFAGLAWLNMGQPIGPFNIEAIPVTAILAQQNLWVLLVALIALGAFLIIESTLRDRDIKIHDLIRLNPITPAVTLGGKLAANLFIAAVLLTGAGAIVAVYQLLYGGAAVRIRPLVDLYGLIGLTTIAASLCLALFAAAVTRSRHASYAVMVLVSSAFGYGWFKGYEHWLYNWPAIDLFTYSDSGGFGLVTSTLLLHRAYVMAAAMLLFWGSVCLTVRREATTHSGEARLWIAGALLAAASVALGGVLIWRIQHGMWSSASEALRAAYERQAKPWLPGMPQPQVTRMDLDLDLFPDRQAFELRGQHVLENTSAAAMRDVYVSVNPRLIARGFMTLDGRPPQTGAPGLLHFTLDRALAPGATAVLRYGWPGRAPDGVPPNGDRFTTFVDERATLLSSMFSWGWLPTMGYSSEAELMGRARAANGLRPGRTLFLDRFSTGDASTLGFMRRNVPLWYHAKIRAPRSQRVVSSGRLVSARDQGDRREYEFASDRPVYMIAVMAGRWAERGDGANTVLYDPAHAYNADEILRTMQAARSLYSSIYGPYPFSSLTTAEIPQMGVWAGMAFPGLIPLSDDIAFLTTASARRANVNALIVAHEIAHEWWGSTIWPAHARGAQSLTEGVATYSALLAVERSLGEQRRRALFEDLEYFYLNNRLPDQEQSILELDGTRGNDTPIKYHRAGLVLYMLSRVIGVDRFVGILGEFCQRYAFAREHPTFLGLVRLIEARAPESARFIEEFLRGKAVPRLEFSQVSRQQGAGGRWRTTFTLTNAGAGTVDVDIAARTRPSREARTRLSVGPRSSASGIIDSDFKPLTLQFDPDTTILLQNREQSVHRF